jgi:hypothetical protein
MNDMVHLSERMPLVAGGAGHWSFAESRHLAECADCQAEWGLVQATRRIGLDLEGSLDLPAIEAGVLAGLRAAPKPTRRIRRAVWLIPLGVAAAVLLMVLREPSTAPDSPSAASLLPELETLTSAELESVLTLLPAGELPPGPDGFEDLSESEVSSVLQDLEG